MRNICLTNLIFLLICANNEKNLQSAASLCKREVQISAYKAIQKVYLLMRQR